MCDVMRLCYENGTHDWFYGDPAERAAFPQTDLSAFIYAYHVGQVRSGQVGSCHDATPVVNSTPYNATGCTTKDGFFRPAGLRHAPGMRDSNEDSSSAQPERRSMPSYRELSVISVKMKYAKYIG